MTSDSPWSLISEPDGEAMESPVAFSSNPYPSQGALNVSDDFQIDEETEGHVPVLAITGEIDLSKAPEVKERLMAIASSGAQLAIVDLTEVTFLDSTALGVLVSGLKRIRSGGGDLRLVVTRPNLVKVFEITGLLELFPLASSRAEAAA
jgi:anti-sigma B factor antagonist